MESKLFYYLLFKRNFKKEPRVLLYFRKYNIRDNIPAKFFFFRFYPQIVILVQDRKTEACDDRKSLDLFSQYR